MLLQLQHPPTALRRVGTRITIIAVAVAISACAGDSPVEPEFAASARSVPLISQASAISGSGLTATIGDSIVATYGTTITLKSGSVSSRARVTSWKLISDRAIGSISGSGSSATLTLSSISGRGLIVAELAGKRDTSAIWNANPLDVAEVRIVGVSNPVEVGLSVRPRLEFTVKSEKASTVVANWSSSNSAATYDAGSGQFTFRNSGSVQLEATSGGTRTTFTTTVQSPVTSGSIAFASTRVLVGDSTTVTASFRDATGHVVACNTTNWTSSATNGIVQLIPGASKLVATLIGVVAGSVTVSVVCDGSTAFAATMTVEPSSIQTPPQAGTIALRIVRIDSTLPGTVVVSSGLPLAKGVLMPGGVSGLRLTSGTLELSRYAAALEGRYDDGSVRSVLLQFSVDATNIGLPLALAPTGRTMPEAAKGPTSSEPSAIVTYSDPRELVATGIVGPTKSLLQTPTNPAYYARYDADFAKYEAIHWSTTTEITILNFYDRALAYYAQWARTANPRYLTRANILARRYRKEYLEANNYGLTEWNSSLDGLYVHYLMTGDEASRDAILRSATVFELSRGSSAILADNSHSWMDNRVQARVLSSKVLSWMLGATSLPAVADRGAGYPNLRSEMSNDVRDIIASQSADGAWRWASSCGGSKPFMSGLVSGVLGQYYDEVSPDPAIVTTVAKGYSYLFSKMWVPNQKHFYYLEIGCTGQGTAGSLAPDLNGLFLDGLQWLYRRTGDSKWLDFGDQVFEGGVADAYLQNDKQFNQQYYQSFRWLGAR